MESLYFLVPCALIFIGLAIKVLFWAINNGQYDNLDTEAHRILFDAEKSSKDKPPVAENPLTADKSPAADGAADDKNSPA
jgi:cbb3-type cytochrome oxidase maturation protein